MIVTTHIEYCHPGKHTQALSRVFVEEEGSLMQIWLITHPEAELIPCNQKPLPYFSLFLAGMWGGQMACEILVP